MTSRQKTIQMIRRCSEHQVRGNVPMVYDEVPENAYALWAVQYNPDTPRNRYMIHWITVKCVQYDQFERWYI